MSYDAAGSSNTLKLLVGTVLDSLALMRPEGASVLAQAFMTSLS